MLVLSRKRQEAVVVVRRRDDDGIIKITVLDISHGRVRLGFDVDGSVVVHRLEVWQRISDNEHHDGNLELP